MKKPDKPTSMRSRASHLPMSRSTLKKGSGKKSTNADPSRKQSRGSVPRAEKSERKRLTGVLDNEAKRLCHLRDDPSCRRCGKRGDAVHHIISRRRTGGGCRWLLGNLLLLCHTCHAFAHIHVDDFRKWAIQEIGEQTWMEINNARNRDELSLDSLDELISFYRGVN